MGQGRHSRIQIIPKEEIKQDENKNEIIPKEEKVEEKIENDIDNANNKSNSEIGNQKLEEESVKFEPENQKGN